MKRQRKVKYKKEINAWTVLLSWLSIVPDTRKLPVEFPVRAHAHVSA